MRKPFMVKFTGTPEAGKTTSIKNIANKLLNYGYRVEILQESAENLPQEIPKGTWEANLWMHYQTISKILQASYFQADVVFIDRGLIDSKFYGKKFLWEGYCSDEQYKKFEDQFIEELMPDFLVALVVTPEIAVKRRGGVGRLVNTEYIARYNELFFRYYKEIEVRKILVNTAKMDVHEMNSQIFQLISRILL